MQELMENVPMGIQFGVISLQSDSVTAAIKGFLVSLLQAVAIVIVVLLFFMGLRTGLLIGFILLLTICGSFIFLKGQGVILERISLGALNLLPIPVLDGGHLLFYLIEALTGRPVPERVQGLGYQMGLIMVMSLMAFALYNDFSRL